MHSHTCTIAMKTSLPLECWHVTTPHRPTNFDVAKDAPVLIKQAHMLMLQMGRPRVQFACASALAMLVEGHPEACPLVQSHGGIIALASMLHQAGAQAKKAAAEALQVTFPAWLSPCFCWQA